MTAAHTERVVEVLKVETFPEGSRITCRFDTPCSEPIAPGELYGEPDSASRSFVVHRVVARHGDVVTFETFGPDARRALQVGASFFFRAWWLPAAMEAALDTDSAWEHRAYPGNGDHDHCLFTWETIAAYAEHKTGWWSQKHGWVTEKAYQDFIIDDAYHVRDAKAP